MPSRCVCNTVWGWVAPSSLLPPRPSSQVLMSVAISLVWLIPGLNPAAAATPLWSILPAIALGLLGTVAYKRWELRQEGGASSVDVVPGLEPVPDSMHARPVRASGAAVAAPCDDDATDAGAAAGSGGALATPLLLSSEGINAGGLG